MNEKDKIKLELADVYIQIEQFQAALQDALRRKQILLQKLYSENEDKQKENQK